MKNQIAQQTNIQCFLLETTNTFLASLRRFVFSGSSNACPSAHGYHDAQAPIDTIDRNNIKGSDGPVSGDLHDHFDSRWPKKCAHCDYQFVDTDQWQVFHDEIYLSKASHAFSSSLRSSEYMTLREAPVGAMWDAHWYSRSGPDGIHLMVRLPGKYDWHVDGRANNCTLPNDDKHYCWVRHGVQPLVTVDKNGHTCKAGAGSIQTPDWHGFLRNGYLVTS